MESKNNQSIKKKQRAKPKEKSQQKKNSKLNKTQTVKKKKSKKEEVVEFDNNDDGIMSEVFVNDYREIKEKYNTENNKSQKVLTDYELAVLIGNRATQLALNAPPLIDNIEGMDHIQIAEEELKQKKSPFLFCRTIGNKEEYYKLEDITVEDF